MPIRITGLNSGLDTEAIISALVSSYNYKTQKYQKAQTKLTWKQDAWKNLNTKIYSLYTSVGNLRFSSAYNVKSVTASDATKVTATATSNAVNGSYSVQVTSLAKTGYLTGGKLESGITGSSTLSDLGYTDGDGTISLTTGGKTTDISVTGDTTVQEFVNKLKEAGVNASYDESNRRIYVSAKKTGVENDFSLSGSDASGTAALTELGLNVVSDAALAEYEELAKYAGMDEAQLKAIVTQKADAFAENTNLEKINSYYEDAIAYAKAVEGIKAVGIESGDEELLKALATADDLKDKYVDSAGNIYTKNGDKYTTVDSNGTIEVEEADITDTSKYTPASEKYEELKEKYFAKTDENGVVQTDDEGAVIIDESALSTFKTNLSTIKSVADKAEAASGVEVTLTNKVTDADGNVTSSSEETLTVDLAQMLQNIEDGNTGTAAEFEAACKESIAKVKAEMKLNNETMAANPKLTKDTTDEQIKTLMEKAEYAAGIVSYDDEGNVKVNLADSAGATRVDGSDAIIYVNGAQYTGTSNTFAVNGMTFTATGITVTEDEMQEAIENGTEDVGAVTVTVNTDVQGIYDKIKDFLSQYNALINEMSSLFNAESASGYEPLTDEEKDALSDTEVEKYEKKIKDSILRRDDTLSSIISSMTSAMSKGVDIDMDGDGKNDKTYYLSTFGIRTLGYFNAAKNEQNAFHIDGDEDDVNTSGNEDKLMAAISEDPDTIIQFMQGVAKNLYDAVDAKMKSTSLKTVYTVYNDKEMASEYSDYTSLIRKWQERLEDQEDYYYKKFSAMETALSKLNSQTSSMSGLFG